jgi:hypothetical protein
MMTFIDAFPRTRGGKQGEKDRDRSFSRARMRPRDGRKRKNAAVNIAAVTS